MITPKKPAEAKIYPEEGGRPAEGMKLKYQLNIDIPEDIFRLVGESQLNRYGQLIAIFEEGAKIFADRNARYGDAIRLGGVMAAHYHMVGIIGRLQQMIVVSPDHGEGNRAAVVDALTDLMNYAAIARMMLEEDNWTGKF